MQHKIWPCNGKSSSRSFIYESSSLITCQQGHDGLRGCPKTKLNSNAAHAFVVASSPQPSEHASMVSQPLQLFLWSLCLCFEYVSLKIAIWSALIALSLAKHTLTRHTQALLLEVVQRMSECSAVTVVGDAIWGDESGIVHVLQVELDPPCSALSFILTRSRFFSSIKIFSTSLTATQPFNHSPLRHLNCIFIL
jgi:hypothetical protein